MRERGDILLLSTYELGHQPHGLASPLAFLERAGYRPLAQDLSIDHFDDAAVKRARFVGISVPMHTALRLGAHAAERIRAMNPAAHICVYGLYAPLNRDYLLSELADSVIGGEYEQELLSLVDGLERGEDALPKPIVLDRLSFPTPSRRALPVIDRYAKLETEGGARAAGHVEASRGCLHHCRHCPIPAVYEGRFFVVPVETVLADAAQQIAAGARHLTFGDPDFLNGPSHALAIARALHAAHPDVTFDVTIKVEHILRHREIFRELARLGCIFVVSAVESLSTRILALLDKGHSPADVDVAVDLLAAAGIPLRPTLVAFTPWTTPTDYIALLDWIHRRGLHNHIDPIQLAIRLLIPPGSKLLELTEVRDIIGALDEKRLSYSWAHPDARMDALATLAAQLVERYAKGARSNRETFAALDTLGRETLGLPPRSSDGEPSETHPTPPRLSEPWFCCAEPTEGQFTALAALKR